MRGMDKMIQTAKGETIITNDGATILKSIQALHPAAKMLVDLSAAQDVEAGDGTTSVVVLAGSFLGAAEKMLQKGIHPTIVAEAFLKASAKSTEYLTDISTPVDLNDKASLLRAASTSLNSKIVSQYSSTLAPIAVAAVTRLITPTSSNVDLRDVRVVKKIGGTIEDTELIEGVVLNQNVITAAGGPTRMEKAKIAIAQFQLSAPKPDMDNTVVINDYRQMDKVIKEGRQYLLNMCKKIKKANCNVLLLQKSILRDAVDDTSLNFLKRLNILVVKDVERDEIEFLSKSLGCKPIADIEAFTEDKLGYADLVEESSTDDVKVVKITGIKNRGRTVSILAMGSNHLVVEECERSLHDALCVVRCLVKKRALIGGGGAPEIHVSRMLSQYAQSLKGMEAYCFQAFADALEVIPTTLAENAGLNPIAIVTELRNRHALGERNAGINVRKWPHELRISLQGLISNILEEDVVQPLLVSTSAIELATETIHPKSWNRFTCFRADALPAVPKVHPPTRRDTMLFPRVLTKSGLLYFIPDESGKGKRVIRKPCPPPTSVPMDEDFDAYTLETREPVTNVGTIKARSASWAPTSPPLDEDFDAWTYTNTAGPVTGTGTLYEEEYLADSEDGRERDEGMPGAERSESRRHFDNRSLRRRGRLRRGDPLTMSVSRDSDVRGFPTELRLPSERSLIKKPSPSNPVANGKSRKGLGRSQSLSGSTTVSGNGKHKTGARKDALARSSHRRRNEHTRQTVSRRGPVAHDYEVINSRVLEEGPERTVTISTWRERVASEARRSEVAMSVYYLHADDYVTDADSEAEEEPFRASLKSTTKNRKGKGRQKDLLQDGWTRSKPEYYRSSPPLPWRSGSREITRESSSTSQTTVKKRGSTRSSSRSEWVRREYVEPRTLTPIQHPSVPSAIRLEHTPPRSLSNKGLGPKTQVKRTQVASR
ncbi:hypothetical protein D9757_013418 [Collybiopsis confluens]|uniref:T-complex protein 1 subunit delta n=1 Tax=Collybiopsis confluens TaxID=2823264 RepID=A0A8H5CU34_9AGAR|nr:hypothetical protein D9757_013418 [Collybiopsis confluens]